MSGSAVIICSAGGIPGTCLYFRSPMERDKFKFPFPLLADEDKSVIEAFGVWGPKKFMGKEYDGIHRTTFVIDENGILTDVIEKVKTKEHASQILV